MKKTERIIIVILLFIISLSNVSAPVSYAAELTVAKLPISGTQQTKKNPVAPSKLPQAETQSVLGTSTSLLEVGAGNTLQSSAAKRIPIRVQQLTKKVYQTNEPVTVAVTNPDNDPLSTTFASQTIPPLLSRTAMEMSAVSFG